MSEVTVVEMTAVEVVSVGVDSDDRAGTGAQSEVSMS